MTHEQWAWRISLFAHFMDFESLVVFEFQSNKFQTLYFVFILKFAILSLTFSHILLSTSPSFGILCNFNQFSSIFKLIDLSQEISSSIFSFLETWTYLCAQTKFKSIIQKFSASTQTTRLWSYWASFIIKFYE